MKDEAQSLAILRAPCQNVALRNRYTLLPVEETPEHEETDYPEPSESLSNREPFPTENFPRTSHEPRETSNHESETPREPRSGLKNTRNPEISNVSQEDCQNELLRFQGKIEGHKAVILLDSGSTQDLISADFVRRHRIPTTTLETQFTVTMADERTSTAGQSCTVPVTLALPNLQESRVFTVFSLAKYDVILGKPWLSATNPSIDYRKNEVRIGNECPWLARIDSDSSATGPLDVQLNFISGKQARRALRQGDHGFLAWVSAAEEKPTLDSDLDLHQIIDLKSGFSLEEQEELLALLHEYSDVLPSELPSRLPPKRSVNHDIILCPEHHRRLDLLTDCLSPCWMRFRYS